jgi:hypothetical protein
MKLGVNMEYDYDDKDYKISVNGVLVSIKTDLSEAIDEFHKQLEINRKERSI